MEARALLTGKVLIEGRNVSYRQLSRALKIDVDEAKRLMFEFHNEHSHENAGSVSATYLVDGFVRFPQRSDVLHGREGVSSPQHEGSLDPSSSLPSEQQPQGDIYMRNLSMIRESDLTQLSTRYSKITALHIYCVGPSQVNNLQGLSDCNQEIKRNYSSEDPLLYGSIYGSLKNQTVRRRKREPFPKGHRIIPPIQPTDVSVSIQSSPDLTVPARQEAATVKFRPVEAKKTIERDHTDFFKGVLQTKPNAKTPTQRLTVASESEKSQLHEDAKVDYASDEDEQFNVTIDHTKPTDTKDPRSQRERRQELERMMEEDVKEADHEVTPISGIVQPGQTHAEEGIRPDTVATEPDKLKTDDIPHDMLQQSTNERKGETRRRGRRRVMKKRTTKDEEGYLVTMEEPGWESFSEDDVTAVTHHSATTQTTNGKSSKDIKSAQGSITSFFSKK